MKRELPICERCKTYLKENRAFKRLERECSLSIIREYNSKNKCCYCLATMRGE